MWEGGNDSCFQIVAERSELLLPGGEIVQYFIEEGECRMVRGETTETRSAADDLVRVLYTDDLVRVAASSVGC